MITYYYNSVDVFSGISRAPLLERSEEIIWTGNAMARIDTIILSGNIKRSDCAGGFSGAYDLTKTLISRFATNFKRFEIRDGTNTIYSCDHTIVESVTIDESKYYDMIPYRIKLLCYVDSYAESYGILEPQETWGFSENPNKTVSITHTISARGINNSNMAIENARNFVSIFTGYSVGRAPTPVFGESSYVIYSDPILISKSENINRYTGEVSITENYLWDNENRSGTNQVLTYTTDTTVDNGFVSVSISGSLQGDMGTDISQTRVTFAAIDFYSIANSEYQAFYDPSGSLMNSPLGFSVTELAQNNKIDFSLSYQNISTTDPYIVDSTTITTKGYESCISVSLSIKSDKGCPSERLRKTKAYFETFDLYAYMSSKWSLYGNGRILGNTITSKSVSFDTLTGTISVGGQICCNSSEDCLCLEGLQYSIDVKPAIPQLSEDPTFEGQGCYAIQNLKFDRRSRFSMSGSARPSKCCSEQAVKSSVISKANQVLGEYFTASDIVLESAQISISTDKTDCSFSFTWNGRELSALSDAYFYATF
jgi:hypothetical protein